jgi:histidinol dehydrogenase
VRVVRCSECDWRGLLAARTIHLEESTSEAVAKIIADVRARGDEALLESARMYDAPGIESIVVREEEIASAELPAHHLRAIQVARDRIVAFHRRQLQALFGEDWEEPDPRSQVRRWRLPANGASQRAIPVSSAGVYAPGGAAAYPSSVLMNAGPAHVLGIGPILVATPARRDGTLHPSVLAAMRELGVRHAFKVGGAAAIAGLAIGTQSIPRVDVVAGPGNRFVNEAKRQLWGQAGFDGYAGPSEVAVLVDATSDPRFAAADLLTQVEHAPDNCGYLVSVGEEPARAALAEIERQLQSAPRREVMRAALSGDSLALVTRDAEEAAEVIDAIRPEHVALCVQDAEEVAKRILNAGSVFLGPYSPQSAGDFVAGPSHTLPTAGAARFASGVSALTFLRFQSVIGLSAAELDELAPAIAAFAEMEGFPQHALGASVRLEASP